MKTTNITLDQMLASVPAHVQTEVELSFAIANRLDQLIKQHGMTKKEFAEAMGCRPSEVSKWLSGQQNFTIRTLSRIATFFNEPLMTVTH